MGAMEVMESCMRSPYGVAIAVIVVLAALCIWLGVMLDKQLQNKSTVGVEDEVSA